MSALYTNLSEIYEGMYQTFINYEDEFAFYSTLLSEYKIKSVLEAGCGTGNLAQRFSVNDFDYVGMDLSDEMLTLARKKNGRAVFVKGDIRNFNLEKRIQACIITGRSISYLVTDGEVKDAFRAIHNNLVEPGILCFDFIDASSFLPSIENGKKISHEVIVKNKKYRRESSWKINVEQKGAFDWHSAFYEAQTEGNETKIGEDQSTIRAFWESEIKTFLNNEGFKVEKVIPRPSYAFDTLVMVAKKI